MTEMMRGVLSPVVTPFDENLAPDFDRWIAHCRWLQAQDCGLAVFGTNSEANSLSAAERIDLLERGLAAGLDPARMMPGTGSCALTEAVELTALAVKGGCGGVLMLPPFYYKGLSEDGLFAFYSEVIQRVGDEHLGLYLYHIPQFAGVPIPHDLIERLVKEYPQTVLGIKDSSGDWSNTKAMLDRFPGFGVFCGSESFLLDNMRNGGAGCISATANINAPAIVDLFDNWQNDDADDRQAKVTRFRKSIEGFAMIPALKSTVAIVTDDPAWNAVRPPLMPLDEATLARLAATLKEQSFTMPGRHEQGAIRSVA